MITAIVQARMGSSRLPGKTLADVGGKPMLDRLLDRLKVSRGVERVVLATTNQMQDRPLVEFARRRGILCTQGREQDVLDRIYQAAKQVGADPIVRVTPDCPLLDPVVLDQVIDRYREGIWDYVSNTLGARFIDGLDVEVFSFRALETAWKEAARPSEREHVTLFLTTHPDRFRLGRVEAPSDQSHLKWSVDTQEDLDFVRRVYRRIGDGPELFQWQDLLALLREEPALVGTIDRSVSPEGLFRSLASDPPVSESTRSMEKSNQLRERAKAVIPGASQTLSKGPSQFIQGVAPAFLVRGLGAEVWDVDGNRYLDTAMALGPMILGYGDPDVDAAVREQIKHGPSFSLPHRLELDVAEHLQERIPSAEMVRFGKNGSDATSGAVRLARAVTGRERIACCGYHGWQDWYIGSTSWSRGVPHAVRDLTHPFEYNRVESLEMLFRAHPRQIAAVILEPVGLEPPQNRFLEEVRDLARRNGAILIFDEVLTGFRFGLQGAAGYFGVQPDLICYGKSLANGFPLSALAGRRDLMCELEKVFFSFTFGGEAVSLAAALATLGKLQRQQVADHIWNVGRKLRDGVNYFARAYGLEGIVECRGMPPRTAMRFNGTGEAGELEMRSLFQQECFKRGVLFTGSHLLGLAHQDAQIDRLLRVYRTAMEKLAQALKEGSVQARLEGKSVEPVFRTSVQGATR